MSRRRRRRKMSKPIMMTEAFKQECRADFEKALALTKCADGRLNFTKVFADLNRKATIFFTPIAWTKMTKLLQEFDNEVAWYGVTERGADPDKDEYIIRDILVYPQRVTGATVDMDPVECSKWVQEHMEQGDERFNSFCMQGHSHVKMATSPSGTDIHHQEEILRDVRKNGFYIFMIWNKYLVSTNKIYDLQKNVLFENTDITVDVLCDGETVSDFIAEAKSQVKETTYYYNGYKSYDSKTPASGSKTPATTTPVCQSWDKPAVVVHPKEQEQPVAKPEEKKRVRIDAGWRKQNGLYVPEDDGADDPYGYGDYGDYTGAYMGGK